MGKVTIEDISRQTGLSRGTVSRALNDRPDISNQTKQKVLEACRQLNYVPSHAARSLATGRSYAVAVLVDDLRSTFAASYLRGVIVRARAQRYAVFVTELGTDIEAAMQHLQSLARERIDALLLATRLAADQASEVVELLASKPLVCCEGMDGVATDLLMPDYVESGRLVGRHLLRGPTPDVLYVHAPEIPGARQRLHGFHEVCRENQLDPDQVTITLPGGAGEHVDQLEAVRGRIGSVRALAATDDFLAIELMLLSRQAGRVPGRDIAIVGQGNEAVGTKIWPQLTTVDLNGEEIGARSFELAMQRATKARQDAAVTTHVAPQLIERTSSHTTG